MYDMEPVVCAERTSLQGILSVMCVLLKGKRSARNKIKKKIKIDFPEVILVGLFQIISFCLCPLMNPNSDIVHYMITRIKGHRRPLLMIFP